MPFIAPPDQETVGPWSYAWRSLCHHDWQTTGLSGDAVLCESGRRDGEMMLLVVDAIDHGEKADELVRLTRSLLEDRLVRGASPVGLLQRLHGLLGPWFAQRRDWESASVAAGAVLLEISGEMWHVGNAGLPAPYARYSAGPWRKLAEVLGPSLGMPHFSGLGPGTYSATAGEEPGLLLCTDGVTDAGGPPQGVAFGKCELAHFLEEAGNVPPGEMIDRLFARLELHASNPWPEDDTTALAVSLELPPP